MAKLKIYELKRFAKDNLSFCSIVETKYKTSWKWIGILSFLIGIALSILSLITIFLGKYVLCNGNLTMNLLLFIPAIFTFVILANYLRNKTLIILKLHKNKKFNLNIGENWNDEDIKRIRVHLLSEKLESIGLANNEQLNSVMSFLEFENNSKKYKYNFTIFIITLILGGFLGVYLNGLLESNTDFETFQKISKLIFSILIEIIFLIFLTEMIIIKKFLLLFRNKNKILIETIHLYMIEKPLK